MQKIRQNGWLLLTLFLWFAIISCEKEDPLPEDNPGPDQLPDDIPEAADENKFVFNNLAIYYYWLNEVPELTDGKLNSKDYYNYYLNKFSDPKELFYRHLYKYGEVDKWSIIFDHYKDIENWLTGISETTGIVPGRISIDNEGTLAALVLYVLKDSPAAGAGIKRGDIIMKVDNIKLNSNNYNDLLFNRLSCTYQMGEATLYGVYENGIEYSVTGKIMQENPVFLDSIYNIEGYKVGYIVYNGFTFAYDEKLGTSYDLLLNDLFTKFKNAGVNKLILDLRYNLGGSAQSASYLASMIYSNDSTKLFSKTQYNDFVQSQLIKLYGEESLNNYLNYYIDTVTWKIHDENGIYLRSVKTPKMPITSLNISDLYVLISGNSVSASELLINGLKPFDINLKCVGTTTRGKFVGSTTFKDWIDYDNDIVNPNHTLGMQLIIAKFVNSAGEADYIGGIPPDIEVQENLLNFLPFGDTDEPLLSAALDDIRGVMAVKSAKAPLKSVKFPGIVKDWPYPDGLMYMDQKPTQTFRKFSFKTD